MRTFPLVLVLGFACLAAPAQAVDLTKIERTIAKEPAYQTKTPRYCLVVFGPEAKTRVWLVLDGKILYVDRNGDGDLTRPDNRVEFNAKRAIWETASRADDKIQFSHLLVRIKDKDRAEIYLTRKMALAHRKTGKDSLMEMAGLTDISFRSWMNRDNIEEFEFRFGDRPQDAPIVHFDGPLTLRPMDTKQMFVRGDQPSRFAVMVGTPGVGKGTFTQVLFMPGDPDGVAEIVFPNRDPAAKPIVVQVALKSPGWWGDLLGSVRVPDNAGTGMAKVTLSFPNWKERPVAPAAFEVPIEDAPPSKAAPKPWREERMARQSWFWAAVLALVVALPARAQVVRGVLSMDNARSSCWGGVARDAIARLYDVEKDLISLDADAGTIAFQIRKGKTLPVEKIYESFQATSLYGPNGIDSVRYLEITVLGEVVVGERAAYLKVGGTTQRFALGNDPDSKAPAGGKTAFQRLREALARGAKVTSVTGRVHDWTAPLTVKDPDQLAGKKPLLLIVTNFQTSPN